MMKKLAAMILASQIVLLGSCTASKIDSSEPQTPAQNEIEQPSAETGKTDGSDNHDAVSDMTIVTNGGYEIKMSALKHQNENADAKVYYLADISPEALMKVYSALGRTPSGRVAVKLSTGEKGGHNFLNPDLIKDLVQTVKGTIVECNTAYGGSRDKTADHKKVAEEHGFTAIANVDIMDEDGEMELPIVGGKQLDKNIVGDHLKNYDFIVVLSHFKGHAMAGFGGALKNISIGIGSSRGKAYIHSAGGKYGTWSSPQDDFTEAMAEAAKSVSDYESNGEKMLYINVMNNLSVDCDCDSHPADPTMKNVGVLASLDPVALDQACVDLVYAVPDSADLIQRMEEKKGIHIIEHAANIKLGSREYKLIDLAK